MLCFARPLWAGKTVLVAEFRAGVKGAQDLGERLATLLSTQTSFGVVSPSEARRQSRDKIDADVAKCAGQPVCIGALAEPLGSNEVLLVGISQLGDLVVTLQRIDAKKGELGSRIAETLNPGAEPSDADLTAWLKRLYPPDAFVRYGSILVHADIGGARILLNGRNEGTTPMGALKVRAPASYQLQLEKLGYAPFRAKLDIVPDATVEVHASMTLKTGPLRWYKRWYVWAAIGGAVAVTTAGLAIYYGTRVDQTPMGELIPPPAP